MIQVRLLSDHEEPDYRAFVQENTKALFYHTNHYRLFLKKLLAADERYLLAYEDSQLRGVLPAFLVKGALGPCLNSLPFFGSNGGVLDIKGRKDIRHSLLQAFLDQAQKDRALSATIIASPFEDQPETYESFFPEGPADYRIGQITRLTPQTDADEKVLTASFGPFTRRMIRKAMKKGCGVEEQNDQEAIGFLAKVHGENMSLKGGKEKPEAFFERLPHFFTPGKDYKIWVARLDGRMVAALLVFYYNRTVEYYIPAIVHDYRSHQPLSLIIFKAMQDAAARGFEYWNWGGTWPSQTGVYRFKKRWNSSDHLYGYYHALFDQSLLERSRREIEDACPYAYMLPFSQLTDR